MRYKLVCFDLDGTLADNITSSWQLFHDFFEVDREKREENRGRFYLGEIPYVEWARRDAQLWRDKGATKQQFFEAMDGSTVAMPGARDVLMRLKRAGMKLAIISGSVNVMLEYLFPDYREIFDDVFITELFFGPDGRIIEVKPTPFDMDGKAVALKNIAAREKIPLKECVFIGDHSNDVQAAEIAGLSIAFNCENAELRKAAKCIVEGKDLRKILEHILIP